MGQSSTDQNPPYKRVNYFQGQLLSETDFQDEQTYHQEKQRLHNRLLHGWGIVCGLTVSVRRSIVRVQPGAAIDCKGNEIIIPEAFEAVLPEPPTTQFVVLEYTETPISMVPVPGAGENQPSRIHEGFTIRYQEEDPLRDHGRSTSICGVCDVSHPIPLVKLSYNRNKWAVKLDSRSRPHWWARFLAALSGQTQGLHRH